MGPIAVLFRRHLRVFLRDRLMVVISVMTPFVLFVLFLVFFRDLMTDRIYETAVGLDRDRAVYMSDAWLFAGVVSLACFTSSLGMLASFVEDRVSHRFNEYLVSPVRRWHLAVSYVLSSFTVCVAVAWVALALAPLWTWLSDQPMMSGRQFLAALGGSALACLTFSAFNVCVVTCLSSQGSFSGYTIGLGVASGFLSFCYVPPQFLTESVNNVVSSLPFAHAAVLVRQPVMAPALDRLVEDLPDPGPRASVRQLLMNHTAIQIEVDGQTLGTGTIVAILFGLAVVLMGLASYRMNRVIR
ncbi:MAG: ABC transporter permease [Propionibacteriaceae bacterium]|jgi:multidrug/hemolysin transport system permease protein|nr:ABC transporter permease [Propionibacteriaceae bacterium]